MSFTYHAFENNGLYETCQDSGRALITKIPEDLAKFKAPTLRNNTLTYLYMHNGSMETMEEVIGHYAAGGTPHTSKSKLISGFEITDQDKEALFAFLNCLTEERLTARAWE